MNIKTRAKLLLGVLCVVVTGALIGGALTHHDRPAVSHAPLVSMHDTCQAEDDPCWMGE